MISSIEVKDNIIQKPVLFFFFLYCPVVRGRARDEEKKKT